MKICALILGLILLSSGIVFARLNESYEIYRSQDCYIRGNFTYCMPSRSRNRTYYSIYYPTGITRAGIIREHNHHHNHYMSPVARSIHHYPPMRHRGGVSMRIAM